MANSVREAIDLAHSIGFPVVLKALSSQMIHKTEFGAVRLNIKNDKELEEQYFQMINFLDRLNPKIEITGVLVQEMILDGTEVILGMYQDPELGPVITCGLGGVFTEILRDIAFRIPPFNSLIAREMIEELKGFEGTKRLSEKKEIGHQCINRNYCEIFLVVYSIEREG